MNFRTGIAAFLTLALASSAFAGTPTLRQQEEAAQALYARLSLELKRTGSDVIPDAAGFAKLPSSEYAKGISRLQELIDTQSDPITPGQSFLSTQTLGTLGQIKTELSTYRSKQQQNFTDTITRNQTVLSDLFRPNDGDSEPSGTKTYEHVQTALKTLADTKATPEARAKAFQEFSDEFKKLPEDKRCNFDTVMQDLQGYQDEISGTDKSLAKVAESEKTRSEQVDTADRAAALRDQAKSTPAGKGPGSGPGAGPGSGPGGSSSPPSPTPSPSPSPLAGGGGGGSGGGAGGSGGGSGGSQIGEEVDMPNPSDFLPKEDSIRALVESFSQSNADDFMPAIQKLIESGANFATGNTATAAINLGQAVSALPSFDQLRSAAAQALAQPTITRPRQAAAQTTQRVLTAATQSNVGGSAPAPRTTFRPKGAPSANQAVLRLADGRRVVSGVATKTEALHLTRKGLFAVREEARYVTGPVDPQLAAELERAGLLIAGSDKARAVDKVPPTGRALAPRPLTPHAPRRTIQNPLGGGTHSK
ncbi:MAG: hypothetical protein KDD51_06570 [Bdellovibrionales bacterium]|nr:hypothetical protein [Bdellovibrionales bacterium]